MPINPQNSGAKNDLPPQYYLDFHSSSQITYLGSKTSSINLSFACIICHMLSMLHLVDGEIYISRQFSGYRKQ